MLGKGLPSGLAARRRVGATSVAKPIHHLIASMLISDAMHASRLTPLPQPSPWFVVRCPAALHQVSVIAPLGQLAGGAIKPLRRLFPEPSQLRLQVLAASGFALVICIGPDQDRLRETT